MDSDQFPSGRKSASSFNACARAICPNDFNISLFNKTVSYEFGDKAKALLTLFKAAMLLS